MTTRSVFSDAELQSIVELHDWRDGAQCLTCGEAWPCWLHTLSRELQQARAALKEAEGALEAAIDYLNTLGAPAAPLADMRVRGRLRMALHGARSVLPVEEP